MVTSAPSSPMTPLHQWSVKRPFAFDLNTGGLGFRSVGYVQYSDRFSVLKARVLFYNEIYYGNTLFNKLTMDHS